MRILDELAVAFDALSGRRVPRRVDRSGSLRECLPNPLPVGTWHCLSQQLGCDLPVLRKDRWRWELSAGCETVGDLARHVAAVRPNEPPVYTERAWAESQVYAGVRAALSEALNVDPEDVSREVRLRADLNAE